MALMALKLASPQSVVCCTASITERSIWRPSPVRSFWRYPVSEAKAATMPAMS